MTVHRRWFIVPATTNSEGQIVPKYLDAEPALAYNGETVAPDVVSEHYPALTQTHSGVSEWYVVQGVGRDTPAWEALTSISVKGDTRNLATNMADVAPVLNARLPGLDRSGEAWERSFRMTLPPQR